MLFIYLINLQWKQRLVFPLPTAGDDDDDDDGDDDDDDDGDDFHPFGRRPLGLRMAREELPFYPREKLIEKQKFFQSMSKHTYLKGPFDKITSVAIPVAFAAASCYMIGRGIYNMSHGIGKKE